MAVIELRLVVQADPVLLAAIRDVTDALRGNVAALNRNSRSMDIVAKEMDDLTVEVAANVDAEQSAIAVMNNLAERLREAGTDPVKLKALTDQLTASKDALAAAIVANTPADPTIGGTSDQPATA